MYSLLKWFLPKLLILTALLIGCILPNLLSAAASPETQFHIGGVWSCYRGTGVIQITEINGIVTAVQGNDGGGEWHTSNIHQSSPSELSYSWVYISGHNKSLSGNHVLKFESDTLGSGVSNWGTVHNPFTLAHISSVQQNKRSIEKPDTNKYVHFPFAPYPIYSNQLYTRNSKKFDIKENIGRIIAYCGLLIMFIYEIYTGVLHTRRNITFNKNPKMFSLCCGFMLFALLTCPLFVIPSSELSKLFFAKLFFGSFFRIGPFQTMSIAWLICSLVTYPLSLIACKLRGQ